MKVRVKDVLLWGRGGGCERETSRTDNSITNMFEHLSAALEDEETRGATSGQLVLTHLSSSWKVLHS